MIFDMLITIPAYNVQEKRRAKFADAAMAHNDALDDVAFYWMMYNGGNDLDIAREKCDVEFSIKVSPAQQ